MFAEVSLMSLGGVYSSEGRDANPSADRGVNSSVPGALTSTTGAERDTSN